MTKNIINIGLPSKGRLKHDTINIFKEKKLNIYSERGERDLFGYIKKLSNVKIIYLHARECIEQLSLGNIDIGFSGYDLLKESEFNIQKNILIKKRLKFLDMPRLFLQLLISGLMCKLCLILMKLQTNSKKRKKRLLRVATKYPNLTRQFFILQGYNPISISSESRKY